MHKSSCLFTVSKNAKKATFEITRNCNYSCDHCCTSSSNRIPEKLGTDQTKAVFDELGINGFSTVYSSGGEPFTRSDITGVLDHATLNPNIRTLNIASNGSLLGEHETEWISGNEKIGSVLISVDGHNPAIHNGLRCAEKSFEDATDAIKRLVKRNARIRMGTVIWKDSVAYLRPIADLAHSLGVNTLFYNWLIPIGRAALNPKIVPDPALYLPVARDLHQIQREYRDRVNIDFHRFYPIDNDFDDCPAGDTYIHVLDDGRVAPCSWIAKLAPQFITHDHIGDKPLKELIQYPEIASFREMVRLHRETYGPGCMAMTLSETGTFDAHDPLKYPEGLYFQLERGERNVRQNTPNFLRIYR
ncbi:MAG: radical SAM protein [Candidatus Aenigmatarchaeota archaeon]